MTRQSNHLLLASAIVFITVIPAAASSATDAPGEPPLGFDERVAAFELIEDVYWSHRIWPDANPTAKPRRDEVISREHIAAKVERSLLLEAALEQIWGENITPDRLQLELNRIAKDTRHPTLLGDVFAALGHDPALIVESFVRPRLVERLVRERFSWDRSIHGELRDHVEAELAGVRNVADLDEAAAHVSDVDWILVDEAGAIDPPTGAELRLSPDEWRSRIQELAGRFRDIPPRGPSATVPSDPGELLARQAGKGVSPFFETVGGFAVVEIIEAGEGRLRIASASWHKVSFSDWLESVEHNLGPAAPSGGSYALPMLASGDPCTDDTWISTAGSGPPTGRNSHTAVWTGTEVIVWGGHDGSPANTGGRYEPASDSWLPTSTVGAPSVRYVHTAVWTGTEMIVWGGVDSSAALNTGGRYNPDTDGWAAVTPADAPSIRYAHEAVWTGTEMIVWGGQSGSIYLNTGGRYDPFMDSWTATTITGAPVGRAYGEAIWTSTEMVLWGGFDGVSLDNGGRYDPVADSWTTTTPIGAPSARYNTIAVWTGDEMIVWAGHSGVSPLNSGGLYDPDTDSWTPTTQAGAPGVRNVHVGVWTGEEMIVWGGTDQVSSFDTGGVYDPFMDSWTPTTTTGAPSGRSGTAAVWTGTEMVVWGGYDGSKLDTGGRYCASGVLGIDYGDAPDPTYPTLSASDGARHPFDGVLFLGSTVDGEPDGQPTGNADGDDMDGSDDEDGVVFTSTLRLGLGAGLDATASAAGYLNAWIDFNADGDWDDAGEQIFTDEAMAPGINNLQLNVPLNAALGGTFARFRLDSVGGLTPTGLAADGEVEDFALSVEPSAEVAVSISDGPDPVVQGGRLSYFVYLGNNGGLDASGVVLTDTLDAEVSFVAASLPTCSENAGVVTCTLSDLLAGGSTMVEIEVDVNVGFTGTISNTAIVTLSEEDPVPANNTDIEETGVAAVGPYIFVDGFETGATDRWSSMSP